jgi:hypothetical protein
MLHFELSIAEQELLAEVLENSLLKLEVEIEHTDRHEYREALKERRRVMKTLLEKLNTPAAVAM